jgi:hypothetical protein
MTHAPRALVAVNIEDQEFLCGPRSFVIDINAARRRLRSSLAAAPTKLHHASMDGKAPAQPSGGRFSASRRQNDRFGRCARSCGAISINSAPSNSRLQREPAVQRFRSIKTLQKFSSIHPDVHDHFNQERHLVSRRIYKQRRAIALAEWLGVAAYRRLRPERLNLTGGAAHNASRARWKAAYASAYGDGLSALGSWRALTLLIAAAAELRSVCNPRPTAATIADPSVESLMK